MLKGTVKWFGAQHGAVVPDDGGAHCFVHISAVERAGSGILSEGQRLEYGLNRNEARRLSTFELRLVE
jgi:cold shock protein